jgi:hypothetical protein
MRALIVSRIRPNRTHRALLARRGQSLGQASGCSRLAPERSQAETRSGLLQLRHADRAHECRSDTLRCHTSCHIGTTTACARASRNRPPFDRENAIRAYESPRRAASSPHLGSVTGVATTCRPRWSNAVGRRRSDQRAASRSYLIASACPGLRIFTPENVS